MAEECVHMPDITWCGICKPRTHSTEADERGTVITASFDSDCYACGGGIWTGEPMLIKNGENLCSEHIPDPPDPSDPFA
jgi:hypothetical protein